jgi:mannose-6-phosphate isomerase-like protein (cupin superfamily)
MSIETEHSWGKEIIFAATEHYTGKFLQFEKAGSKTNMQFHKNKDKTWVVLSGKFILKVIDTSNAEVKEIFLNMGDTWRTIPLLPTQLEALENESSIAEVSTTEDPSDVYNIM